ncbi:hypothetical protein [Paenibacillus sp. CAA11]|uniref:hypothetical protein n=1 Tax=Paenibacillus sp. CAA11 TaxID=1532905 RepID=UPI00131F3A24|nr:hypothetical protein [Paenibacillus sp. CAA11]
MPYDQRPDETDGDPNTIYEDTRIHNAKRTYPLPTQTRYTTQPTEETNGLDETKRT